MPAINSLAAWSKEWVAGDTECRINGAGPDSGPVSCGMHRRMNLDRCPLRRTVIQFRIHRPSRRSSGFAGLSAEANGIELGITDPGFEV